MALTMDNNSNEENDFLSIKSIVSYQDIKNRLTKKSTDAGSLFLQTCRKIYQIGPKLFSQNTYETLSQFSTFAEEILVHLRPSQIKALLGYYQDDQEMIYNRMYILSILHQQGILQHSNGSVSDDGWIGFINALDAHKLDQYMRVFVKIEPITINNPKFFTQLKAHNDLDNLPADLQHTLSLSAVYGTPSFPEDTQIKGFTLINEFVCKRTRTFPRTWKNAMRVAWESPSLEASFELYKLYIERQNWLNSFTIPFAREFFSYFYQKPIFKIFDIEPLTQVCKLLQSANEFNLENFKIVALMPETAFAVCLMLQVKMRLNAQYLQEISQIPEDILKHIYEANQKKVLTVLNLDVLIRLGKLGIDGTVWMNIEPNLFIVSKLSDQTLTQLDLSKINQQTFENIKYLNEKQWIDFYEHLPQAHKHNILNHAKFEKIINLLKHLETLGLCTEENIADIFAQQKLILDDKDLYQSIINIEKSYPSRDQKRLNHIIHKKAVPSLLLNTQSKEFHPRQVSSTLSGELLSTSISQHLETMGIIMKKEELEVYDPSVLQAFSAFIRLDNEDIKLDKEKSMHILGLFYSAPDPIIRCQCLIILSQCGLLRTKHLNSRITKLEALNKTNPALFKEICSEAWLQTETSSTWLEKTLTIGITEEKEPNLNLDETLIQKYYIQNVENSAYLSLYDIKYRIMEHKSSHLVQQVLKLIDKSNINIESVFDQIVETNEEEIQQIHAWLFVLDKSDLLDANNVCNILKQRQNLPANDNFLTAIVMTLKNHHDIKLNNIFKQKNFDRLMSAETSVVAKQKMLEYMSIVLQNPSMSNALSFMASEAVDAAAQVEVVQSTLMQTADVVANTAADLTQKVYEKIKLFPKINLFSSKTNPDLLPYYVSIANQNQHFQNSYYQLHPEKFTEILNILRTQALLTEPNVVWLIEHPNQKMMTRSIKLLAAAHLIQPEDHWQHKIVLLASQTPNDLAKLEKKCLSIINSQHIPAKVKIQTMQNDIETYLSQQSTHNKPR